MNDEEKKLVQINHAIESASAQLSAAKQILREMMPEDASNDDLMKAAEQLAPIHESIEGKVIEGVFDGQNMIGPDKKQYSVPANYASKSKLVEGDTLKLTITQDGSFVYKQIGPVERKRLVGVLTRDEDTGEHKVVAGDNALKVLLASVTYFKGQPGDEVVVLVPEDQQATWAAVENIIKKGE